MVLVFLCFYQVSHWIYHTTFLISVRAFNAVRKADMEEDPPSPLIVDGRVCSIKFSIATLDEIVSTVLFHFGHFPFA